MADLFWNTLLPMALAFILTKLGSRWKLAADIITRAKQILTDPSNPITKTAHAAEQALIQAQFESLAPAVKKLDALVDQGKLEAKAALERGLASSRGMDITRVDPNTGEETKVDTGPPQ